jgi:hypothetical protein
MEATLVKIPMLHDTGIRIAAKDVVGDERPTLVLKEEYMAHQELYLAWLNDAYALERSLEQVLEHRVKDAQDHPNMQARVRQHLEETRRQAERLQACIERV